MTRVPDCRRMADGAPISASTAAATRFVWLGVAMISASLPVSAQELPPPPDAYAAVPSASLSEPIARTEDGGLTVTLEEGSGSVVLYYAPRSRMREALVSQTLEPFRAACIAPCSLSVVPEDYVLALGLPEGDLSQYPLVRRTLHLDASVGLRVGVISHASEREIGDAFLWTALGLFVVSIAVGLAVAGALHDDIASAAIVGVGAGTAAIMSLVGLGFCLRFDGGTLEPFQL